MSRKKTISWSIFGQNLRRYRNAAGMSQKALGKVLDVTGSMVGQWEKAKKHPSADQLFAIANHFGVTVDELVRRLSGQERMRLLLHFDLPSLRSDFEDAASSVKKVLSALAAAEKTLARPPNERRARGPSR